MRRWVANIGSGNSEPEESLHVRQCMLCGSS
jgi:hypothetical protein